MNPTGGHANSYQPKTTLLLVLIRTKIWSQQGGMQILINQQDTLARYIIFWTQKWTQQGGIQIYIKPNKYSKAVTTKISKIIPKRRRKNRRN